MDAHLILLLTWLTASAFMVGYAKRHPGDPAPLWWAFGDLLGFVSVLSLVARPDLPLLLAVFLTNLGLLGQVLMHHQAVRLMLGGTLPRALLAVPVAVTAANMGLAALEVETLKRAALLSGAASIMLAHLAATGLRAKPAFEVAPLRVIGAMATAFSLLHASRAVTSLAMPPTGDIVFLPPTLSGYAVALCLVVLVMNLSFLWLADVRRAHRQSEDLVRLAAELAKARDAADRANQAKTGFLASMSHELRTPLNAVLGFSELLARDEGRPLPADQQAWVGHISGAGNQLLQLITDILDLAKIESGGVPVTLAPVDPSDLMRETAAALHAEARRRQVALRVEEEAPPVRADRVRLLQVLMNLASNAVKYNRPGGEVRISAAPLPEGGWVRFLVEDTGQGIPAGRQAELFQPFNRLGAESGPVEGSGIGLSIVRRLVDVMGGRLGFESWEGVGSHFWVDLPAAAGAGAPVQAAGPAPAASLAGARILCVEDNPANAELLRDQLSRLAGAQVVSAPNAELGLRLAALHRPDLVVTDIRMAGLDGIQFRARLAAGPLSGVPVVALTADAGPATKERLERAGFAAVLAKPCPADLLLSTLAGVLECRGGFAAAGARPVVRSA